ncbi:MAG: hypothetical protein ACRC62_03535 [Microcoleus sp.]
MEIAQHNILIRKGATFDPAFQFVHEIVLSKDLRSGATLLNIEPLTVALPLGTVLSFPLPDSCETVDVTLSADALVIGSRTLQIEPYTGKATVSCGTGAEGSPIDLTGRIYRGAIRKTEGDPAPLATFTCTTTPAEGIVVASLTSEVTRILPTNCEWLDLPQAQIPERDFQDRNQFVIERKNKEIDIYQQGYYWDLEYQIGLRVEAVFRGRAFVCWEAAQ